jgi:hypothetical protein
MVTPTRPWPNPPPFRVPQPDPWTRKGNWQKWFAWYPVKVNGDTQWLKFVYRRKWINVFHSGDEFKTEYGTVFDILKD